MASMEGKVVAVTGAASGIGFAIAKVLHSRGAQLALADLTQGPLEKAAETLQGSSSNSGKITSTALDVRHRQEVDNWIKNTVKEFGRLDGAANFAGVAPSWGPIQDTTSETWEWVMGVNCTGVFHCLSAEIAAMTNGGSIVNAASVAGMGGMAGIACYSASKHAVIGLTRSSALELGDKNIRVNCVAPGLIDTPMTKGLNVSLDNYPIKRRGLPEEIARTVAFLLSDESSFQTGSVVAVDGGWTA